MSTLFLGHISSEAKKIVGMLSGKEHVDVKTLKPQSHKATDLSSPHKQLIKDEAKVAQIKELWTTTDPPVAEIARQIGGKRQTVDGIIKKLIAQRELAERAKSGQ